ncbi:hypothetical protein J6T21_00930 [Candidatus Saccharibacteria bacterium]|nr:hypothetical protein [Candidatus Saccharibacteria bacterium]
MHFETDNNKIVEKMGISFPTMMSYPDYIYERGVTDGLLPEYMAKQFQEMGVEYFNFVDCNPDAENFYLSEDESDALAAYFRHYRQSPVNRFYNQAKMKLADMFNDDTDRNQQEMIDKYLGRDRLMQFYEYDDEKYDTLWHLFRDEALRFWYVGSILELLERRYEVDLNDLDLDPNRYDLAMARRNAYGILTASLKDGREIKFAPKGKEGSIIIFNAKRIKGRRFVRVVERQNVEIVSEKENPYIKMSLNLF